MSESLSQIKEQLNEYFQKFEKKQKIIIFSAAIFAILALTGMIYYFTRPEYIELYSNLEPQQTGEIMDTLESNNIKAKIGQTSGSILVTKKDEKKAQVVVATQGLPTPRFSIEDALSGNSFMMTSEERSKLYIYGLQNHLAGIIEEMKGIKKAEVSLAIPEKTGFILKDDENLATASVTLKLKSDTILDNRSINGIAVLVSNAVGGLLPENVTIHGDDGRVLNEHPQKDSDIFSSNNNMILQQNAQNELERSITNFLSSVYGPENVVVMANVKLDFDSEVTEIKEFTPPIADETTGIPRSLQELSQNVVNDGTGGRPGTDTNTDDETQQYEEGDENYSTYSEASKTINYEINELYKKIVKAQGQVKDITVAVFLNSTSLEDGDLTEEEKEKLEKTISAAAGLDTRVVQVNVQQFNDTRVADGDIDVPVERPSWLI
ncbi:MAG TPA: flagellar basal-body MS-ring/collar protein FliF, partial [Oscillospiraceae bacterium]|nr:flagellar basal-body MS-ring/collar protein FliF [Oscillospiraceae bacterium]